MTIQASRPVGAKQSRFEGSLKSAEPV